MSQRVECLSDGSMSCQFSARNVFTLCYFNTFVSALLESDGFILFISLRPSSPPMVSIIYVLLNSNCQFKRPVFIHIPHNSQASAPLPILRVLYDERHLLVQPSCFQPIQ